MLESIHGWSWPVLATAATAVLLLLTVVVRWWHRIHPATACAPWLDIWVSLFTWVPWVAGGIHSGWPGLPAIFVAQLAALHIFCLGDRLLRGRRGPTIMATLEKVVGVGGNQLGLYCTLPALPLFLQIRLAQCVLYPVLRMAVKFPKYRQQDWISLSRQKFDGLAGYDLVFCLYCEWAAGVYGLGAEMLRNVESFWCPIRFHPEKKCENCQVDFPDLNHWVRPAGDMAEVARELDARYRGRSTHSWWGHPDRRPDQKQSDPLP